MSKIIAFVKRVLAWGESIVRDPISGDASSARVIACWFAFVAGIVAIITAWRGHEAAATLAALSGGGVGGILGRAKAEPKE
jgi:hypothetical protein